MAKQNQLPAGSQARSRRASRWPRSRIALFLMLAAVGLCADLGSKSWTFSRPDLFQGVPCWLWTGHVGIQLSLNEGALFGIGQGKVWFFALSSVAAAIAIPIWLFGYHAARSASLTAALGCVMAGVLGNLYDRLGLHALTWDQFDPSRTGAPVYAVRDWILFCWQWAPGQPDHLVWPNFNIADSLLVCSIPVLLWNSSAAQTTEPRDPS